MVSSYSPLSPDVSGSASAASSALSYRAPISLRALFRTKTSTEVLAEAAEDELADAHGGGGGGLKKCLSIFDIVAYGVGATIGTGIFLITGPAAHMAGPAIVLSFLLASLSCLFSAFCYCEFAVRVPVAGSAYTFTYVTLGELAAWFIGWNLTLEYAISGAATARAWSDNLALFFDSIGAPLPGWMDAIDIGFDSISLLAPVIVVICTGVLLLGVKNSARFNLFITVINISIIIFIIIAGSTKVDTANWTAPMPENLKNPPSGCSHASSWVPCGLNGVVSGAARVFYSYIGFDSVTTLAEEAEDPKRDLPRGIIGTLAIAAALFVGASMTVTGMVPWYALNVDTPLASAFDTVGVGWASTLIAGVTVTVLTGNALTSLFGQPRIFYRMAKDGLFFRVFQVVHPTTKTPVWSTIITGILVSLISLAFPLDALTNMISIGTLFAFATVCAGVVILRFESPEKQLIRLNRDQAAEPDSHTLSLVSAPHRSLSTVQYLWRSAVFWLFLFLLPALGTCISLQNISEISIAWPILFAILSVACVIRIALLPVDEANYPKGGQFVCPFVPWLPCAGIFTNLYMVASLDVLSYVRIAVWTVVGFAIYFLYGFAHSRIAHRPGPENKNVNGNHQNSETS